MPVQVIPRLRRSRLETFFVSICLYLKDRWFRYWSSHQMWTRWTYQFTSVNADGLGDLRDIEGGSASAVEGAGEE